MRLQLYLVLLFIDLSSIVGGFSAANLLRFGNLHHGPGLSLALGCIPVFVMLAFSGSCYSIEVLASPGLGIRRALRALALTVMGLLIALFSVKTAGGVSRIVFAVGLTTAGSMIGLLRFVFGRSCGRKYQWNFRNEVLLVDGINILPTAGQIVVFADGLGISPTSNNPSQFAQLGRLLANCDSVMLATKPDRRALWVATLKGCGIAVEVLAPELDGLGALRFRNAEGGSALLVSVGPLGLRQKLLKRCLDLSISIPVLVIAAPLMLGISAAIKLTSRGPVLFRQPRVGQSNRLFYVMKYRTMRVDVADQAGTRSASRDDDRVTSFGRLLRMTSLDELPQLFNVISGNMSLVGPRPHALESKAGQRLFWDADSRYWQRGAVRPGITGLAQVRGFRGATDKEEDLINRVQSDLDYLLEWSIWRDLKIIMQTARVLIHPKAY
ncbi:MAG: hypothetical protein NVS3B5_06440 [Sphingomicrobium sp.]